MSDSKVLSKVASGRTVEVVEIDAAREMTARLLAMGVITHAELTVVHNDHPGPFVVSVRDSRMVLGRGMAEKILVREK